MPDDEDYLVPVGVGAIRREGADVTLVAWARGVEWALLAARRLEREGVDCEVVDMRWLRPLDMELVYQSFRKTNRCVIVEESLPMYSFGSEIAARIQEDMFDYMDAPVKRVSAMDVPLPYSREIELMALPDADKVVAAVKEIV